MFKNKLWLKFFIEADSFKTCSMDWRVQIGPLTKKTQLNNFMKEKPVFMINMLFKQIFGHAFVVFIGKYLDNIKLLKGMIRHLDNNSHSS